MHHPQVWDFQIHPLNTIQCANSHTRIAITHQLAHAHAHAKIPSYPHIFSFLPFFLQSYTNPAPEIIQNTSSQLFPSLKNLSHYSYLLSFQILRSQTSIPSLIHISLSYLSSPIPQSTSQNSHSYHGDQSSNLKQSQIHIPSLSSPVSKFRPKTKTTQKPHKNTQKHSNYFTHTQKALPHPKFSSPFLTPLPIPSGFISPHHTAPHRTPNLLQNQPKNPTKYLPSIKSFSLHLLIFNIKPHPHYLLSQPYFFTPSTYSSLTLLLPYPWLIQALVIILLYHFITSLSHHLTASS